MTPLQVDNTIRKLDEDLNRFEAELREAKISTGVEMEGE